MSRAPQASSTVRARSAGPWRPLDAVAKPPDPRCGTPAQRARRGTRDALLAAMAVTSLSPSAMEASPRVAAAPRLIENLIGSLLELAIHALEDLRDRRRTTR